MIKIENVSKAYPAGALRVQGIKDVSLEISAGEFVALVGPSGSGKTTVLNIVGGLMKPDAGRVTINGHEVNSLGAGALCRFRLYHVGFIFQDYNLIPTLTAFENVELVLAAQKMPIKERRQRVQGLLARVGLEALMHRRPSQMSRGQQQRVAVSRALVTRPAVILGDEMTANLDSATGSDLMDFMYELNQQEKLTVLYATHDSAMMKRADRIIRLKDGAVEHED